MRETVTNLAVQLLYLVTHLTLADVVDMVLVAAVFFVVFQALARTRALQLLRGAITFAILGAALLVLLPLNTFNWLLRGLLLAGAIALPLLFHDELRRALTGLGQVGRWRRGFGSTFPQSKTAIVAAVTQLASRREGALIVLEAQTPMVEIIATGIPVQAEVLTSELLVTLFHPQTPLHDGAVILRGVRLVAAGCILPVQTEKTGATHLGTRHRAALGLSSQVPDTLIIVVSEETGRISVAHRGRLHQGLSDVQLEAWLDRFQEPLPGPGRSPEWLAVSRLGGWFKGVSLRTTLWNLAMAVGLAILAWVSVSYQTNPLQQGTIPNVPLTITAPSPDLVLMRDLPERIAVRVQAPEELLATLGTHSIRAALALDRLPTGVHRVPIHVTLADGRAQVVSLDPALFDVMLEPLNTVTLTPTITVLDPDSLPPGYALGELHMSPETIILRGPQSLVEQVAEVKAELTLDGRRADFQMTLPLKLLNASGREVAGLKPAPETILVTASILRTFFTREIAVQATLETDSLEEGYEITGLRLSPPVVMLSGRRSVLEAVGDFVVTAPITLTGVRSELTLDVPLILTDGISALDALGKSVNSVVVQVAIAPVTDYLVLSVQPILSSEPLSLTVQLSPDSVSALLIGPRPLLAEIQNNPDLVAVFADLIGYAAGTHLVPLRILAPKGLTINLFPPEVRVTLEETG